MTALRSGLLLLLLGASPLAGCASSGGSQSKPPEAADAQPAAGQPPEQPCAYNRARGEWRRCTSIVGTGMNSKCIEFGDRCEPGK